MEIEENPIPLVDTNSELKEEPPGEMNTCEAPVPQSVAELETTNLVPDTADNDQPDQTLGTIDHTLGTMDQALGTTENVDDTATNDTNSDTIEASPIPSIKSLGSGGDFEEPLTPFTDVSSKSETSRSQTGSGRVTPASQSDQSVCMSSSEKSTPSKKRKSTDAQGRQIDFEPQPQTGRVPTTLIHRSVKFPFRAGIHWKKGEKLEAMDFMHKWFPAKIKEINTENLTVLIHFDGWNQRFDEWVDMASDRIRPLMRHSERKDKGKKLKGDYKIGEQVYAKWTDCKMYPAKITAISPNGAYEVIFYDGFKKQVQPINLRPMPGEFKKKTFEINPVPVEVIKKTKIRKELIGVATPDAMSEVQKQRSGERRRSSEKSSGEKASKPKTSTKTKMIPADLFKQSCVDRDELEIIGSELATTQTPYTEKLDLQGEYVTSHSMNFYSESDPQMSMAPSTSALPSTSYAPGVLPPKAFVVESDHNRYKCTFEGCNKGFRKEHLLEYHMKYYHIDGAAAPPPPQPSRKRRKTAGSTDSESASSSKKSVHRQRRHLSLESGLHKEMQVDIKNEVISPVTTYPPETGEISTQTTPVKGSEQDSMDESYPSIKDEYGSSSSKHQRTQSQDSNWTEDSSVTDLEGEDSLKPDELVNCICDFYEENGLMIQCEVCMCWQHAGCFGITERTLPKTYVCFVCENPPGVRESAKHIHEQDWLKNGEVPHFNYVQSTPVSEERRNIIKATNSLVTDIHQLNTVLHSLKLQLKILKTKDEQKLKMWRMDWDLMDQFDESADNLNEGLDQDQDQPDQDEIGEGHAENGLGIKDIKKEEVVDVKVEMYADVGGSGKNVSGHINIKQEEVSDARITNENAALLAAGSIKQEIEDVQRSDQSENIQGLTSTSNITGIPTTSNSAGNEYTSTNTSTTAGISNTSSATEVTSNISAAGKASTSSIVSGTSVNTNMAGCSTNMTSASTNLAGITTTSTPTGIAGTSISSFGSPDSVKDSGASYAGNNSHDHSDQKKHSEVEMEEANHSDSTESALEDPMEMCEKNLLSHILRVQDEISSRMDQIEEQIQLLEAVEATQYNKEPPTQQNILSDMPQLKRLLEAVESAQYNKEPPTQPNILSDMPQLKRLLEAVEAAQYNKEPPTQPNILSDMPQLKRCMRLMHGDLNKVKKMAIFH